MKGKRPFEHSSHELACVCVLEGGDFFLRKEEKENMEQRERERGAI